MRQWEDFTVVPGDVAEADATDWAPLPHNGLGALVAYLAGAERVRGVRRAPGPTRVVCLRDGVEERFERPASAEERDAIEEGIAHYLGMSHTPPSPEGVEWEIRLPAGMTSGDLDRAVNQAILGAPDLDFEAEKVAVARYLGSLFARGSGTVSE